MIDGPLNRYAQKQQRETDNPHERIVWLDIEAWTERGDTLQPFFDCQKALNRAMRDIGTRMEAHRNANNGSDDDGLYKLSDTIQEAQNAIRDALHVITDEDD